MSKMSFKLSGQQQMEELVPGMFVSNVRHSSPRVSSGIRAQSASSGQILSTKKTRQDDRMASHSDLQGLK